MILGYPPSHQNRSLEHERLSGEPMPGVFRDGKNLVLPRGGNISRYCLCCGRPSVGEPICKTLHESYSGGGTAGGAGSADGIFAVIYAIVLIIYLISLFAEFASARGRTVTFGFCLEHAKKRRDMIRTTKLMVLGIFVTLIAGIVGFAKMSPNPSAASLLFSIGACVCSLGLFIGSIIVGVHVPGVALVKEQKQMLWIKGVGEPILSAGAPYVAPAPEAPKKKA